MEGCCTTARNWYYSAFHNSTWTNSYEFSTWMELLGLLHIHTRSTLLHDKISWQSLGQHIVSMWHCHSTHIYEYDFRPKFHHNHTTKEVSMG